MFRLIANLVLLLAFATGLGCSVAPSRPAPSAPEPPLLRLPPSALPGGLALQQRLTFRYGERSETVDALVEADAESVRVLVHMQGQVALRLVWDGKTLQETRADWLPPQLQGERVLSDLQLVYWPQEAINAALPPEWSLSYGPALRLLEYKLYGKLVIGVEYLADDVVVLKSLDDQHDFELRIESTPVTP